MGPTRLVIPANPLTCDRPVVITPDVKVDRKLSPCREFANVSVIYPHHREAFRRGITGEVQGGWPGGLEKRCYVVAP